MKIFSNFDTRLCEVQHQKACEMYGEDNVLFVRRDRIYLYIKVYHKIFWALAVLVLCVTLWYYSGSSRGIVIWWIIGLISWLTIWFIAFQKWVDWWMDYAIINPRQVIQYDQTWLIKRITRTLDLAKIKSINIQKNSLMTSIFDLWDIVFFSEWDESHGDIRLNYIKNPIELKSKITTIMHNALSARQSSNQETGDV